MNRSLEAEIHHLHAEICQALSDPKRIAILYELADGRTLQPGALDEAVHERQQLGGTGPGAAPDLLFR